MSMCSHNRYFTFLSQTNMSKRYNGSRGIGYRNYAWYDTSPMPLYMKKQLKDRTQWMKVASHSNDYNYCRYVYANRYNNNTVIEQEQDDVFVEEDETLMNSFKPRMLGLTDEPFREINSAYRHYSTKELTHIYWNLLKEHCDEQKEKEDENEDESDEQKEKENKDESKNE
jgi:hypothetical protein